MIASAVATAPSPSWPPPKQRPIAVTIQSVAAVVTPVTKLPRFRIAPPPIKPTPVRIPSGSRIRSITPEGISRLAANRQQDIGLNHRNGRRQCDQNCRPQRTKEIAIRFKQAPYSAFQDTPVNSLRPNRLVLGIAPSQGISLQFEVKRPGSVLDLAAVKMDFRYDD